MSGSKFEVDKERLDAFLMPTIERTFSSLKEYRESAKALVEELELQKYRPKYIVEWLRESQDMPMRVSTNPFTVRVVDASSHCPQSIVSVTPTSDNHSQSSVRPLDA